MGRLLKANERASAMRSGTGNPPRLGAGRPVRQEQAEGILVAALGMLAAHLVDGEAKRASEECKGDFASIAFRSKSKSGIGHGDRRS
jgi:hypothetical protein